MLTDHPKQNVTNINVEKENKSKDNVFRQIKRIRETHSFKRQIIKGKSRKQFQKSTKEELLMFLFLSLVELVFPLRHQNG